jgi:hypothetical protein
LIVIGDGPLFVPPKVAKAATSRSPGAGLLVSVRVNELLVQALVTWTIAPRTWLNDFAKSGEE